MARLLLEDENEYKKMSKEVSLYGDGKASSRIVRALSGESIEEFSPTLSPRNGIKNDSGKF